MSSDEIKLKGLVYDQVYECLSQHYNTGKLGYVTMIGGEAINHYLDHKIETGDFDLKFVVNPEYTDKEDDIRKINIIRLKVIKSLLKCLHNLKTPKGYEYVYPKLAIKVRNKAAIVYLEENKLFYVDQRTGEEKFMFYKENKVFTILLFYKPIKKKEQFFGLIDLSLFYRRPKAYSYFGTRIYDTFLNKPFNQKNPIPYIIDQRIRYPTINYLLFDNFRMIFISLDNLVIHKDEPDEIKKWNTKLGKYWDKVNIMIKLVKANNNLTNQMKKTFDLYKPLAHLNMLCYREDWVYTPKLQDKPECDDQYLKQLKEFEDNFFKVAQLINSIKYH